MSYKCTLFFQSLFIKVILKQKTNKAFVAKVLGCNFAQIGYFLIVENYDKRRSFAESK